MKKRFKYGDMLVFGDHRTARREYKELKIGYKNPTFPTAFKRAFPRFSRLSSYSGGKSKFLIIKKDHPSPWDLI